MSSATSSALNCRPAAATLSSRCCRDAVPGMTSIAGERASSQARATCRSVALCRAAISPDQVDVLETLDRGPRDERDVFLFAQVDERLRATVGEVVAVLDRRDRRQLLGAPELLLGDVGQSDVADLALAPGARRGRRWSPRGEPGGRAGGTGAAGSVRVAAAEGCPRTPCGGSRAGRWASTVPVPDVRDHPWWQ